MKTVAYNNKISVMKRAAAILAALCIVVSMAGCTVPFQSAELNTAYAESGSEIPQVSGFLFGNEINDRLAEIFTPYANLARKAVYDSEMELNVVYSMVENSGESVGDKSYTVRMRIEDSDGNGLTVAEATISGLSTVDFVSPSDVDWLSDADIIFSAISLDKLGLEPDLTALDTAIDKGYALDVMETLYETVAEREIDISDVAVDCEDRVKKALKLELIDNSYSDGSYDSSESLKSHEALAYYRELVQAIERDAYGSQSETIDGTQLARLIELFSDVCVADDTWDEVANADLEQVALDEGFDCGITRRDAAELIWKINEQLPDYGVSYNDNSLDYVDDSDSIWVRRAMTYDFMDYYGDSTLFAPEESMTAVNAIDTAESYVECKYYDCLDDGDNYLALLDYAYTKRDVIVTLGKVADYFIEKEEEPNSFETVEVVNDRDYNWFYSQLDTGDYSSVNCMPSIATMATHWYYEDSTVTVNEMRMTNELTIYDGWTAYELRDALDSYNVPYTVEDATMENILAALDEGGIVLAQYSDRPYSESGHCYVIYGYREYGDYDLGGSVTFIVNDSDSIKYRTSIFGRENGNGDEIEGSFAIWTISRFVSDVTVIPQP